MNQNKRLEIVCMALKNSWNNDIESDLFSEEMRVDVNDIATTFFHYQKLFTKRTGKVFTTLLPRKYSKKEWKEMQDNAEDGAIR